MVRVLVYVVIVFLLAVGLAWLADRPGALLLTWQGYEIRTSLMVAAVTLVTIVAVIALIGAAIRWIFNTPRMLGRFFGNRRRDRGYRALTAGMIAVGAGDVRAARRAAVESRSLLGEEPLVLLLSAQAAQLAGDGDGARTSFEALERRPETRVLGLHGLYVEARRQGEHEAARHFAEEAASGHSPRIAWAGAALFEYQSRAGDWLGALRTLAANADAKLIERDEARRLRAVLLTAQAMALEAGDPDEARAAALEALRLEPDLTEAAVVAGRLYSRADEIRRAVKTLEAAWKVAPHPDLAEAYAAVRPGDSMRDRLKRMQRLNELRPNHPEGAMALARAAIDAHDWPAARAALDGLVKARPSERVCLLMAEIEEREHGDQGRIRTWLTRALTAPRDPVWTADGQVFDRWAPVSPVSGRVGAFEWKVVAEPPPSREAVELEAEIGASPPRILPPETAPIVASAQREADEVTDIVPELQPVPPLDTAEAPPPGGPLEPPGTRMLAPNPPPGPTPVLLHAPDDPGPAEGAPPPRRRFRLF